MTTSVLPALKIQSPAWSPLDLLYATNVAVGALSGSSLSGDLRASQYSSPNLWFLSSTTNLMQYNAISNAWLQLASPALTPALSPGGCSVFCPSQGPRGTLATGATTEKITLTTALSTAVSANQLVGNRIRIVGNASGSSGKIEERNIISNTSGTTPIIRLDTALSFSPILGDGYEFLTGRLFMLTGGILAAGSFKYYDLCTNSYSGNLSITNLPATVSTDSSFISLDELHTPIVGAAAAAVNGEVGGFFGTMIATASAATTLTGQAANLDAEVLANEYRNFQIRIVEDTAIPTAVGQRRRITSHTAGVSPVYTVPTWTVTPSATAKYVIENNNDLLLWTTLSTNTYRYEPIGNTWDTTTYAVRPVAMGAGCLSAQGFGGIQDTDKNFRYSYIYSFRGGAVSTLDLFDIAGATTGSWTGAIPYDNQGSTTFGASVGGEYIAVNNKLFINNTQISAIPCSMSYFDLSKISLKSYRPAPVAAGTAAVVAGNRLATNTYVDGNTKKSLIYFIPSATSAQIAQMFRSLFFI